jgi:hypothetical protein
MFLSKHSVFNRVACGSIQVVTKVARFSQGIVNLAELAAAGMID